MSLLAPGWSQPKLLGEQPSQLELIRVYMSLIQTVINIDHTASLGHWTTERHQLSHVHLPSKL